MPEIALAQNRLRWLDILIHTKTLIQQSRKQNVMLYEQIRMTIRVSECINEMTYLYALLTPSPAIVPDYNALQVNC